MAFYTFRQNNSGGSFDQDGQVDVYVIIEAHGVKMANVLAQTHGIYFDGCARGMDCSCCGDRWNALWFLEEDEGTEVPMIYGKTMGQCVVGDSEGKYSWDRRPTIGEGSSYDSKAIVYYLDGTKRVFPEAV